MGGEGGLGAHVAAALLDESGGAISAEDEAEISVYVAIAAVGGSRPCEINGCFVVGRAGGGAPIHHHKISDEACVLDGVPVFQSLAT